MPFERLRGGSIAVPPSPRGFDAVTSEAAAMTVECRAGEIAGRGTAIGPGSRRARLAKCRNPPAEQAKVCGLRAASSVHAAESLLQPSNPQFLVQAGVL